MDGSSILLCRARPVPASSPGDQGTVEGGSEGLGKGCGHGMLRLLVLQRLPTMLIVAANTSYQCVISETMGPIRAQRMAKQEPAIENQLCEPFVHSHYTCPHVVVNSRPTCIYNVCISLNRIRTPGA